MAPAAKYSHEEQQQKIVLAAISCIENSSLLDFKMSDISKKSGLSMGSVYKHIQSKADVLVLLAININKQAIKIFQEIFQLPLTTPEKLIALKMLNLDCLYMYSFGPQLFTLTANQSIISKASKTWTDELIKNFVSIENLCIELIQSAIATGELMCDTTQEKDFIAEVILGNWSISCGYLLVVNQQQSLGNNNGYYTLALPPKPQDPIVQSNLKLINAYPWKKRVEQSRLTEIQQMLISKNLH